MAQPNPNQFPPNPNNGLDPEEIAAFGLQGLYSEQPIAPNPSDQNYGGLAASKRGMGADFAAGTADVPWYDPAQNMSNGVDGKYAWELAAGVDPATGKATRINPRYTDALTRGKGANATIDSERAPIRPVLGIPLRDVRIFGTHYTGEPNERQ